MEFRKKIELQKVDFEIDYHSRLVSLGSCFSENIGNKLHDRRFKILQNPQGIIFNPLALASVFDNFHQNEVFEKETKFFSWNAHSSINWTTFSTFHEEFNSIKENFNEAMKDATHVFVTFGSAWGYHHQELQQVVANCHKMPQTLFEKKLSSVEEIVVKWTEIIKSYPNIHWIFTVSPVRHWKDGVRENNVSKGVLHQSIHELLKLDRVSYFPSYEIVMDELRDYRFFKNDMLHPNDLAIDYVWEKFTETYFSQNTKGVIAEVEKLNRMLSHRVMGDNASEMGKFEALLEKQKEKVNLLLG